MIDKIKSLLDIFDVGDFKFFLMVAKKNFKNLISITLLISLITLLFSLNQEKLLSMKCFNEYGNYTNSNKIPNWAK